MSTKEIYCYVSIALTFIGFYPYIVSIYKSQTKPHVFSWVIWGLSTLIVFFAQLADEGGVGAWPTGVSAVITFYVAFLAYQKRADIHISRMDWFFFILALASIPAWYVTSHPLTAVLILTAIDILGSVPTFRKIYAQPFSENALFYVIICIRSFVSIFALEKYSWTTVLFPGAITLMCLLIVMLLQYRRGKVSQAEFV